MASIGHQPPFPRPALPPSATLAWLPWRLPLLAPFSAQRILLRAALIVALLLVNKLGAAGSVAFFGILLVMVMRSPESAFMAFTIGMVGLVSNMAIVPKNLVWTPCRLAILFVCAARFSADLAGMGRSLFRYGYYSALCLFVFIAALCSIASGYYLQIALLKLVSFSVGLTAVLAGVMVLQVRRTDLTEQFISVAAVIVINGFLAMLFGNAYTRAVAGDLYGTSSYFAGPFYHPNATGPFCALLVTLLFATWVFSPRRNLRICLALIVPLLYFIWASRSRTGLASAVIGVIFVFLLTVLAWGPGWLRLNLNRSRRSMVAWATVIVLATFIADGISTGRVSAAFMSLANKYNQKSETVEMQSLLATRQSLIERGWQGFLERPLTGLGFEVSLDPFFVRNAGLFSAPIEKGFLPTAVLEEVGIFGATAFAIFLISFIVSLAMQRNAVGLAMFLTYLVTNLGEVTIFAFGGPGGIGWALVGAGMLIGSTCLVPRWLPRPTPFR